MASVKYFYNAKTLKFERTPFRWTTWLGRLITFITVSATFFYGLFVLQNRFLETEREKALRSENEALKRHQSVVENNIAQTQIILASLSLKDQAIYKRIFLSEKPVSISEKKAADNLLTTEVTAFERKIKSLMNKAQATYQKATFRNVRFAKLFWPKKQDMKEMQSYPTQIPVKNFTADRLACGFGEHINPFNKLLYAHEGIDIAAEKGSDVISSGEGQVISIGLQSTPYGEGNYIEIQHDKGYKTKYAHLDAIKVVRGQKVKQGQSIGTIGTSGGAIAPHLHYEVSKDNNLVNPIYFFTEQLNEKEWLGLIDDNKKVKQALD
jgi:murein DD-endopeptidase MepM/ murein hydrolase activator NlpD